MSGEDSEEKVSIRRLIKKSDRKFDTTTLPADIQRVFNHLKDAHGDEYALHFVFIMRTAIELHRAWHMTLLTSKICQGVKDKFNMRMTWELGVFKLKFRVEDGGWEIHRKVPYDYDSEFQDIYMRIAVALSDGQISIHEALNYQTECKQGKHTAKSGLFLRDFPGRLVLYPLLAMSCAVIFFGGDWKDGGVAALCGFATGVIEYFLAEGLGGEAKVLIDIIVGTATGVIGSLFYRFHGETYCLTAIFLGTLYWFFYGTAFVIGLLEIIAGELEVGVTRFIAVSVKTFVLCLGASFGMLITLEDASSAWLNQSDNCGAIDLDEEWWRIPLYLLSSAAALGQYRFPIIGYWRGLIVQLVGYVVQYEFQKYFAQFNALNNLDAASSNVMGAAAAVCAACSLSWIHDQARYYYYSRLLQNDEDLTPSAMGNLAYKSVSLGTKIFNAIGLGRKSDVDAQLMAKKVRSQSTELKDPGHPRSEIELTPEEQAMVTGVIIDAQDHNIWAVLMPAVYQLVPGSIIAKLWFNSIFPPPLVEETMTVELDDGQTFDYTQYSLDAANDNIFSNLMVISTSLSLGLILGFAIVQAFETIFCGCGICSDTATDIYGGVSAESKRARAKGRRTGMYTADNEDPTENEVPDNVPENPGFGRKSVNKAAAGEEGSNDVEEVAATPSEVAEA